MKLRTRLVFSFITALLLVLVAAPQLPIYGDRMQFGFSILWIAFCLLVIAANLHALLRLGRGEVLQRPALSKEHRAAIKRLQRYKHRRQLSR